MNRDTTKRQRQMKKHRKSSINYEPGDLVYHRRRPAAPMLVMAICTNYRDTVVEVMIGADIIRYKAINLRKFECED